MSVEKPGPGQGHEDLERNFQRDAAEQLSRVLRDQAELQESIIARAMGDDYDEVLDYRNAEQKVTEAFDEIIATTDQPLAPAGQTPMEALLSQEGDPPLQEDPARPEALELYDTIKIKMELAQREVLSPYLIVRGELFTAAEVEGEGEDAMMSMTRLVPDLKSGTIQELVAAGNKSGQQLRVHLMRMDPSTGFALSAERSLQLERKLAGYLEELEELAQMEPSDLLTMLVSDNHQGPPEVETDK